MPIGGMPGCGWETSLSALSKLVQSWSRYGIRHPGSQLLVRQTAQALAQVIELVVVSDWLEWMGIQLRWSMASGWRCLLHVAPKNRNLCGCMAKLGGFRLLD